MSKNPNAPSFFDRVHEVVRMIPRGRVATYGQIAAIVSHSQAARTVGWALHALVEGTDVPWQRVVNARGQVSLVGVGGITQRFLLEAEGVAADGEGRVDLSEYQWSGLGWPEVEALREGWSKDTSRET